MRMRVTALLLVCLGAWMHTAESGAAEADAGTMYPEDQDGSGDDLEMSGSGSGEEGLNVPSFSTAAAPTTKESDWVAVVTENEDGPIEEATTTRPTMTSEATPAPGVPATSAVAIDMGADGEVGGAEAPATTATPVSPDAADPTHALVDPAADTTEPPTEIPAAAPDQFTTPGVPWELPEEPLREATSASPVATEAVDTPPREASTPVPKAMEPGPVETTQSLLTTRSSPTTAVPPVGVDTVVEVSTALPEEEEEEEEEEEIPTPTEKTDLIPAYTPALETELDSTPDEMASGEGGIAASTDSPTPTETAEPDAPLIPSGDGYHPRIIPETRANEDNTIPENSDDSDMTFIFEDAGKTEEAFSENQSLLERKEVLGGVIAGGVVGLAFAVMMVSLMVYRMKKKDEGSYSLDEHKHPNGGYQKARREEEFLA